MELGSGLNEDVIVEKNVALYVDTDEVLTGDVYGSEVSILKCKVTDDSNITTHPVESGGKISEYQVFNPVEIDIEILLPSSLYETVLRDIKRFYKSGTKFRIITKEGAYSNLVITSKPIELDPDNVDRLVYSLHFEQVIEVQPKYIQIPVENVDNPEDSSTVKLGENTNKRSILFTGASKIGELL